MRKNSSYPQSNPATNALLMALVYLVLTLPCLFGIGVFLEWLIRRREDRKP